LLQYVNADCTRIYGPFPGQPGELGISLVRNTYEKQTTACVHVSVTSVISFPSKTTLCNDLVHSIDNAQLAMLVLINLSAVLDTADQSILLTVLLNCFFVEGRNSSRAVQVVPYWQITDFCMTIFSTDCSLSQGSVIGFIQNHLHLIPIYFSGPRCGNSRHPKMRKVSQCHISWFKAFLQLLSTK